MTPLPSKLTYVQRVGLRRTMPAFRMTFFYKHHEVINIEGEVPIDKKLFCYHRFYLTWCCN